MYDPLCNSTHYYIIIGIGLTFLAGSFAQLRLLEELDFTAPHLKMVYGTILHFYLSLAFSLIIVDTIKIVFDWDVACGVNMDTIIKFFLCANIFALFSSYPIGTREIREIRAKKQVTEFSFPPDETIDSTICINDQRATA